MKKTPIFILLAIAYFGVCAQPNTNTLYTGVELGIAVQNLSQDSIYTGFRAAAFAEFPLNNKWWIGTGLGYEDLGRETTYLDITGAGGIDVTGAPILIYRIGEFDYKYFSIPLTLKRYFGRFHIATGLNTYIFYRTLVDYRWEYKFLPNDESSLLFDRHGADDIRQFNHAFHIAAGLNLPLTELWDIFIETEADYFLKPLFKIGGNNVPRRLVYINVGFRKAFSPF